MRTKEAFFGERGPGKPAEGSILRREWTRRQISAECFLAQAAPFLLKKNGLELIHLLS